MIGKTVSHYEIREKLGGGGMGVVYRAHDSRLERDVALKFLPPQLSFDDEIKQRFVHEARSASALDHPNICTIHDIGETEEGQLFIAMALYEGRTLLERLSDGALSVDEALDVAIQTADALATAHAAGIVHRDVKPANLILVEDGLVKLLDFGLAKDEQLNLTEPGSSMGTIAYMSPEQARGEAVDGRSDVWSLAVVLHEMLAGERPFTGTNEVLVHAILEERPTALPGSVPRELADLVGRALHKDRDQRLASMQVFLEEMRAMRSARMVAAAGPAPTSRGRRAAPLALAVVMIAALGAWWLQRSGQETWARTEALPEVLSLVDNLRYDKPAHDSWRAYRLLDEIGAVLGDDPQVAELKGRVTTKLNLTSEPSGALVRARTYADEDAEWVELGRTPLLDLPVPIGISSVEVELKGYGTVRDILWGMGYFNRDRRYVFDVADEVPKGMARVGVNPVPLQLPGLDHLEREPMADFLIDRLEVTNAQYKAFVDAGGYDDPRFWTEPFVRDGEVLTFEEARAAFVDSTGLPGPSTWESGGYPEGTAEHPVGGLSWYEAAAYAEFAGKELPTIFHWNMVAFTVGSYAIIPLSNFGNEPQPVGQGGENRCTAFDMAGNVREWCWNESSRDGARFILGGGWDDLPYAFNDAFAAAPFDRSPTNGVRCVSVPDDEPNRERLMRKLETPFRDFTAEEPVSDETFDIYLRQFDYDPTPLNATLDREETDEYGTHQVVSFDAAYGDERVSAHLFLPPDREPPYQTVVVFPGSHAIHDASSEHVAGRYFRGLLNSGRAVILPIYQGTYERGNELNSDYPEETTFYKDHVIMWGKDLSRSIDYLESRDDIDTERLAYYGLSWGGAMGGIMPAIESRLRCNVLYVAGLLFQRALPEVDQINYVTRVTQPTLMLNGEYDFFFPVATSQEPMYELLGTPPEDKEYKVYEGAHSVPRAERTKEMLAWLDRYLGAVE